MITHSSILPRSTRSSEVGQRPPAAPCRRAVSGGAGGPRPTRMSRCLPLLACAVAVLLAAGCGRRAGGPGEAGRPVKTEVAVQQDVPIYADSFGRMAALNDVNISPQVNGEIIEIRFREGDYVKKGDVLFVIDPSPYKAQLDRAQAMLDADQVSLKLKQDTLARNKNLLDKNLISVQDYERYQTDVAAAEAQVKGDQASVEMANINLNYCTIRSPVDGLTGRRLVDIGNTVAANPSLVLVNVKTMDPLYIDFTLPETYLRQVRPAMAADTLKVEVTAPDVEGVFPGDLESMDNSVDSNTGTFALRALVPNKDAPLLPGQFVNVRLIIGEKKGAVLVPYEAVQLGQQGMYLFAVTPDKKADLRQVAVGQRHGDKVVVESGAAAGETVVTVGQLGLAPGVPVREEDLTRITAPAGKE